MNSPQYLTIDGTNYAIAKLSAAAQAQVTNIRVVDAEIARLQQQLAITQTARHAYSQALLTEMKQSAAPTEKPKKPRAPAKKKPAAATAE